ncbi:uncharacterized protein L3040_002824 [Drepanopeziza brunnea f. sp. 'multigermtubi']|uniref:DNase1 protein n=1 Tax=Marssonina brunnea f. sp. multigermtubi (strain MB_m1) TaxID=1072389 RepID=K1WQW9_MARBU|nr:DNase1 protein [Drepanopeziza brunnea f. sp. 'multigermtubi' MB_m1]EKD14747.1 DNase1 protein [Drepanopeziza brunnea f. sp. 'multigermtubi' MB_m1]KAJ5050957.1 hypothetical protein L3040_002824 [Drepanopeziza brunnea f. sp. 'multigermtubi']
MQLNVPYVLLALTGLLTNLISAGTIHFVNQDDTDRTIYFTPNEGGEEIDELEIAGLETVEQDFPEAWVGNFYSVSEDEDNVPGMLGEVRFDGFAGQTYFDVSAIVNPEDDEGVKMLFPLLSPTPLSGCQTFPCDNAYNKWDDVRTLSTPESALVCLIGNVDDERKRGFSRGRVSH